MPPQTPTAPTPSVDPTALALSRAIRGAEGGDYNNTSGDNGTSAGAYQWNNYVDGKSQKLTPGQPPANFVSAAKQFGLDPTDFSQANQDHVAYEQIKAQLDAGHSQSEVASWWNSGSYESAGNKGYNSQLGVSYNTPAYVAKVQKIYEQEMQQPGSTLPEAQTPQGNGYVTPPTLPTTPAPSATPPPGTPDPSGGFLQGLSEDLTGSNPDNIGTQLENTAKGAGNFLFPIVGDVAGDIKGGSATGSGKTLLQQGGDLGLSALPFIPGLGEAGEAARGGELAAEGGADVAKTGILSKLLNSGVARGAATGYGAGTLQNLSQGQSIGQALTPNASNLLGAATGGTLSAVLPRLGGLARDISGISPGMASDLSKVGDVSEYDKYVNAAKTRAQQGARMPSPLNLAADQLDNASDQIQSKISKAGQAVGDAKRAGGSIGLKSITDPATGEVSSVGQVAKDFSDRVASDYGLNLKVQNGQVTAEPIAGRARQLASSDATRIENAYQQLLSLKGGGGNVRKATDIMANLDDLVDYSKTDQVGINHDPIEGLLKHTRGNLNNVVRNSAPDLANANDRFSSLKGLEKEIGGMAGKNLQKGELLMKRVFSGDKSGDVNDLFQKIKDETGIDLVNHAVLAKHAIDSFGDSSQKSLLQQAIEGGVEAHTGGVIPAILKAGGNAARKTFANPETIGRNIVKGKSSGILPSLLIKGGARVGAAVGGAAQ